MKPPDCRTLVWLHERRFFLLRPSGGLRRRPRRSATAFSFESELSIQTLSLLEAESRADRGTVIGHKGAEKSGHVSEAPVSWWLIHRLHLSLLSSLCCCLSISGPTTRLRTGFANSAFTLMIFAAPKK